MSRHRLTGELKLDVIDKAFDEINVDFGVVKLRIARTSTHDRIYVQLEMPATEAELIAPPPYESDGRHRIYLQLQPRRRTRGLRK